MLAERLVGAWDLSHPEVFHFLIFFFFLIHCIPLLCYIIIFLLAFCIMCLLVLYAFIFPRCCLIPNTDSILDMGGDPYTLWDRSAFFLMCMFIDRLSVPL